MSSKIYQGVIQQMRDFVTRGFGVIDTNGAVVACSNPGRIGESLAIPVGIDDGFVYDGYTFKSINAIQSTDYFVFVEGMDEVAERYANLVSISFSNIKLYYDEKYDKCNFIKNVILDNILPGDIYLKSRELAFKNEARRVAILIRAVDARDASIYDIVKNLFPDADKDYVINLNDSDVALIKEIGDDIEISDIEKLCSSVADTITGEFYAHIVIGIGSIVNDVVDLARSFKEAQTTLEVGKVFDNEKTIIAYETLGIARLIYQLPTTLCESYLKEVFKRGTVESLDQETLFTIQRFFENSLNVSETSRKLFVHRNTLVYRLEKIKKITGLDLREFDHAIIFKIALMVNKYLKSNPVKF